jgi:hypothetical protein
MLKFIGFFFCGDNSRTGVRRQMNFGTVRDHGHTCKFCLTQFLNMAMVRNFEVMLG